MDRQRIQHLKRLAVQLFALEEQPFLKGLAVFQIEAVQKLAVIEIDRLAQPFATGRAAGQLRMVMGGADATQFLETNHIDHGGGVKLHRFGGDEQRRRRGLDILKRLAHPGEGLAQVAVRRSLGPIGPQQGRQCLTRVGPRPTAGTFWARFHGQIGQQRAGRVGGKFKGGVRPGGLERPQKRQPELHSASTPS